MLLLDDFPPPEVTDDSKVRIIHFLKFEAPSKTGKISTQNFKKFHCSHRRPPTPMHIMNT